MTIKIAIIGGGIAGLSAAHHLVVEKKNKKLDLDITLFESGDRVGGVIKSEIEDGYVVEHGPDSFMIEKPWAYDLCKQFNLPMLTISESNRQAFVALNGKLHPLPDGFFMTVPTKFWSFASSSLFSPTAKLRAAFDLFLPRGNLSEKDESVASFITRRFGKEILEKVGQPLIGGIYTGNADELSAQMAIPQFQALERKYGSLIRGMRQERKTDTASGARYSLFMTPENGVQALVSALAQSLQAEKIFLHAKVTSVQKTNYSKWLIKDSSGRSFEVDGLILAISAHQAAKILPELSLRLSDALTGIESSSSAVINFLFRAADIAEPIKGFGFVVPASEKRNIIACSVISEKFTKRAPNNMVMLRVFMGGALAPQLMALEDEKLKEMALADLQHYLKLTNQPVKTYIARWPRSMPQYKVGHAQLIAQIEPWVREFKSITLAGSCYHGVGIPDCIHDGRIAAENILKVLEGSKVAR